MKLKLALATAILAVSTSAVQAADTGTPDILASISVGAVQNLSKNDARNTRGEYWVTDKDSNIFQGRYYPRVSSYKLKSDSRYNYKLLYKTRNTYVSR